MKKINFLKGISINALYVLFILLASQQLLAQKTYTYKTVPGDALNARMYTLDNGLKVFMTVYKDAPRIQTYIAVRVGSKNDPSQTTGLAHYFEHMMFKGTQHFGTSDWENEKPYINSIDSLFEVYRVQTEDTKRASLYHTIDSISYIASKIAIPNEYDKLMKAIGSQGTNAGTANDYTIYIENIPANQLENWALIEADRFSNPVLRLFHTELETVYEEKNMSLTNDNRKANEAMLKALFPNHPYGKQTTLGETEHLKNPSMKNIREFYAKYYVPNNMAVCLSGDFDPDIAISVIDKYLGKLIKGNVPPFTFDVDVPITEPIVKSVTGLDAENVRLAFRFGGAASEDALMVDLINSILSNGKAGLIDLNLNQKQKVLSASSYSYGLCDYTALVLTGRPKSSQTLDEVKDLLLKQIDLLKKGEFPDWLIEATINNLKLDELKSYETNSGRAMSMANAFLNGISWEKAVSYVDRLSKISKNDVITFANKYLGNNFVIIYKRKGKPEDVTKVKKPPITPIFINREGESEFVKTVKLAKVAEIQPVFLDYDKDITKLKTKTGIEILYKENTENKTFNLYYYFKMGKYNDIYLPFAVNYLNYLGTKQRTAGEIHEEFYKMACSFDVSAGNEDTWVSISGLSENMEKAFRLAEEIMADPQADTAALNNLVSDILKSRQDAKLNQQANFSALVSYGTFGPNSPQKYILNEKDLHLIIPEKLLGIIKSLLKYNHKILFYGPDNKENIIALIDKYHKAPSSLITPPVAIKFTEQETNTNKLYFAHYDAKQSYLQLITKGGSFDKTLASDISLYNSYFGGGMNAIVFQEMREKRSLAYTARSTYQIPSESGKPYMNNSFIATQNDKIIDAFTAFNELFNVMPESETSFKLAKDAIISKINTERFTKMNAIWNYLNAKDLGLTYDIRKDIYTRVPLMTLNDVKAFNEKFIKNKSKTYLVLGKESDMNFNALEKFGMLTRLKTEDIFGY